MLEDLSPAKEAASYRKPPTARAGEGGEEDHGHHVLSDEKHMLARASHAPVCEHPEGLQLLATDAVDDGDPDGEGHVMLDVEQEHRSRFGTFDSRSEPNIVKDTVEEGKDLCEQR